ncbi:MAG: serine hydrolase [Patescibacteria group bacterium]
MYSFNSLQVDLKNEVSKINGQVALKVKFLNSDETFEYNAYAQVWAASVIKIPLVCTVYKQINEKQIYDQERHIIKQENRVDGSGIAKLFSTSTEFTIHDLIVMTLTISDNSATNELIDIVGVGATETYMHKLGLVNTTLRHKMMVKAGKGPNLTTATDITTLLEKLYKKVIPGKDEVLNFMKHTRLRDRLPRKIPNTVEVANKPGSLPEAMHDVGVVFSANPFIFSFLSDDQKDKEITREVISNCAKSCFDYSNQ